METAEWGSLDKGERRLAERQMEVYAAMAEAMDHDVGRLVAELKRTDQLDDTLFLFLSDNGDENDYRMAHSRIGHNYKL